MFIGGLNWETTDRECNQMKTAQDVQNTNVVAESLRDYFSQFGEVVECTVMRDGATGRSRGFGFLTFRDPKTVNIVMVKEHQLDGKIVSCRHDCVECPNLTFYLNRLIPSVPFLATNKNVRVKSSSVE